MTAMSGKAMYPTHSKTFIQGEEEICVKDSKLH